MEWAGEGQEVAVGGEGKDHGDVGEKEEVDLAEEVRIADNGHHSDQGGDGGGEEGEEEGGEGEVGSPIQLVAGDDCSQIPAPTAD